MIRRIGQILVAAGALATIGMGVFFLALRPALFPEDIRFMGASADVLAASAPRLEQWLGHVFAVLAASPRRLASCSCSLSGRLMRWACGRRCICGSR